MAMSVIYVNDSSRRAYLDVPVSPVGGSVDIEIYQDGVLKASIGTVVQEPDNRLSIVVPFNLLQTEKELEIIWKFDYVENAVTNTLIVSTYVQVTIPYISVKDILSIDPRLTEEDARNVEAAVRNVINAHCGQSFGLSEEVLQARGNGTNMLFLPKKLLTLRKFNGVADTTGFVVDSSGNYLTYSIGEFPPVKADAWGLHMHTGGVIHNPNHILLGEFSSKQTYSIDGVWGYRRVPEPVQEAAKILAALYADPDSEYRDRYLTSMAAADWRIQFHAAAFENTGNVRADQLLADFTLSRGWMVL